MPATLAADSRCFENDRDEGGSLCDDSDDPGDDLIIGVFFQTRREKSKRRCKKKKDIEMLFTAGARVKHSLFTLLYWC